MKRKIESCSPEETVEIPLGVFLRRMQTLKKKTQLGKQYRIKHKTYLGLHDGAGIGSRAGTTIIEKGVMLGKYQAGALFDMEGGWREFFTWQELAAGGLKG